MSWVVVSAVSPYFLLVLEPPDLELPLVFPLVLPLVLLPPPDLPPPLLLLLRGGKLWSGRSRLPPQPRTGHMVSMTREV